MPPRSRHTMRLPLLAALLLAAGCSAPRAPEAPAPPPVEPADVPTEPAPEATGAQVDPLPERGPVVPVVAGPTDTLRV
ncbi:MAG: hypothetical protein AAFQ43_03510, partial [Bacteroidota bacterium]